MPMDIIEPALKKITSYGAGCSVQQRSTNIIGSVHKHVDYPTAFEEPFASGKGLGPRCDQPPAKSWNRRTNGGCCQN